MKSTINTHISHLLFDHECVVVPGFGAFLTRQYPAEINNATYMMRPPSKRVVFNARIVENDGLLAKYISRQEGFTYNQAVESIAISVRSWQRILKTGKKVNLPGIGRLYYDREQKIQFSPAIDVNYDKMAFGLHIFRSPAVYRDLEIKRSIQKAIEAHAPVAPKAKKEKRAQPVLRWAAVWVPFLALGMAAGIYLTDLDSPFQNFSGLNPFSYSHSSSDHATPVPSKKVTEAPTAESQGIDRSEFAAGATNTEPDAENTTIDHSNSHQVNSMVRSTDNGFHIVVGSFKEERNATNYVSDLQARGFDAYLATGDQRFHRVAIGNYTSREAAGLKLKQVQQQVNSGAWIYSN